MSEWIRIRIKDFYKDAIEEPEYAYVTKEVYEVLANSFRKEEHAREMMDRRYRIKDAYVEGETEELMIGSVQSAEDTAIEHMELAKIQKAMQALTKVQRRRLWLYFFEGMSTYDISLIEKTNQNAVWKCINAALKKIKNFFEK